jgi:glycopeptide antibiotics resistance protein
VLHDQTTNALIAIALGLVLAVVLFIPVAAAQYRIDGKLGLGDLATLLTGAVYALAIWTYTLLPFPADHTFHCKGSQLRVLGSLKLIHMPAHGGPVALLHEPAFLQIVLNVLLFIPLGYFVRVIMHRGVLVATLLGFAVSLLVEYTQKTGDWHLYSCAYRLFDIDDLIVNTLGATVGSLLSHLVVRRRHQQVVLPTTITLGRRLAGFVSDVLFIGLTGASAALAWRAFEIFGRDHHGAQIDRHVQDVLQWGVPYLVEIVMVLGFGRTVGELVVSLHTRARIRSLAFGSRVLKLAFGIAPLFALAPLPPRWAVGTIAAYGALTVAVAAVTQNKRGLSHVLSHMDLLIGDDSDKDQDQGEVDDSLLEFDGR